MTAVRGYANILARWEWLLLLFLLPLTWLPESPALFILLAVVLIWLLRWLTERRILPQTPYSLSIWLLVLLTAVSLVFFVFDPATSLPKISGLVLGVALFAGATHLARTQNNGIWYVFVFLVAMGTLMAVVGLFGTPWEQPFTLLNLFRQLLPEQLQTVPGAIGGTVNANELAGTLVWIAPLMLAAVLGLRRPLRRQHPIWYIALVVATGFVTIMIIATQSRGGILALLTGVLFMTFLQVRGRWRIVLLIVVGILAVAAFLTLRLAPQTNDIFGDTLGLSSRIEIWQRGLTAVSDYPLTGVGFNGFRRVVHALYPTFLVSEQIDLAHAHNHLLQVALDLGIPGLISYLSLWILSGVLIWEAMRRLRRSRSSDHPYYALLAGLGGSLFAGWVFGLFDTIALGARPSFIWWLLLALVASLHHSVKSHPPGYFHRRRRYREDTATLEPATTPDQTAEAKPGPPPSPPKPPSSSSQGASKPRIRARRPSQTGLPTKQNDP